MKLSLVLSTTLLIIGLLITSSHAQTAGCSLKGVILDCSAAGNSSQAIMETFASAETREILSKPLMERKRFLKNGDLERFRRSMEKNWKRITRLARQQDRRKRSRQLSEDDFQEWVVDFREAEKNYNVAISFYRELNWQGVN